MALRTTLAFQVGGPAGLRQGGGKPQPQPQPLWGLTPGLGVLTGCSIGKGTEDLVQARGLDQSHLGQQ